MFTPDPTILICTILFVFFSLGFVSESAQLRSPMLEPLPKLPPIHRAQTPDRSVLFLSMYCCEAYQLSHRFSFLIAHFYFADNFIKLF
jgi:uncharacterized protein VirK/YbjX